MAHIPEVARMQPSFVTWTHDEATRPKIITLEMLQEVAPEDISVQSSNAGVATELRPVVKNRKYELVVTPARTERIPPCDPDDPLPFRRAGADLPYLRDRSAAAFPGLRVGAGVKFARTRSPDASAPNRLHDEIDPCSVIHAVGGGVADVFRFSYPLRPNGHDHHRDRPADADVQVAPIEAAPAQQTTTTVTTVPVQPTPVVIAPAPGQHVAEIELVVSRGSVQAYFGRRRAARSVEIGRPETQREAAEHRDRHQSLPAATRIPTVPSTSRPTTPGTSWCPSTARAAYVFNIVEWDDDPVVVSALVKVDGVVVFSGHGSEDDFNGWAQKNYGPGVRKTGSREIAFVAAR